jgi:hypothetical protein
VLVSLIISAVALAETPPDASTDAGVVALVNAATGRNLEVGDLCIRRPESLDRVVAVALFTRERGCSPFGVLQGTGWTTDFAVAARDYHAAHGWEEADQTARELMVRAWADGVAMAFRGCASLSDVNFARPDTPDYAPPSIRKTAGELVYGCWVREAGRKKPGESYVRTEVVFDADGGVRAVEEGERFVVAPTP